MGLIRLLSENDAVKIAAGEVIDRPSSVVRELIDNSIDAGATRIEVHLTSGGKNYLEVSDNGTGMNREDLILSVQNHATSKISKFDDIENLSTLGFRGEALASVAAVSRLTIRSRTKESENGNALSLSFGNEPQILPQGMNVGTTILVENLFEKMPARQKFLSSDATETRLIDQEVVKKALAFPEISFRITSNGREKMNLPSVDSHTERILSLFPGLRENHLPLLFEDDQLKIFGLISKPDFYKKNRLYQYFIVNSRAVEWKNFSFAVMSAYQSLLPPSHFPAAFVFLEMKNTELDVNVHPMKREVRFRDSRAVSRAITYSIRESLIRGSVPQNESLQSRFRKPPSESFDQSFFQKGSSKSTPFEAFEKTVTEESSFLFDESEKSEMERILDYRYIGQSFSTYLLLEGENRLLFFDQHAAHERINYERLTGKFRGEIPTQQELLIPIHFEVPVHMSDRFKNLIPTLQSMYFEIEDFGGNSFIIRGIPDYLHYEDAADAVLSFVETLSENENADTHTADFLDGAVKQMACKRSIKAGDEVSAEEVASLLNDLCLCEKPFSCPHGRPVFFSITQTEMESRFKRLGF